LSNGFIRNGHYVYDFSYRDVARELSPIGRKRLGAGAMNRALLATAETLAPDLVLFGHSELVTPATMARLRAMLPEARMALWYVDPLFHTGHLAHLRARTPWLDAVFATTGGPLLRDLKGRAGRAAYLPNPVDASVERLRNFAAPDLSLDLLYFGRPRAQPGDEDRCALLARLQGALGGEARLALYGYAPPELVLGAARERVLAVARAGLNLSRRNDVPLYSSDRLAHLTGNGLATFTPRTPGMAALFSDDEVFYFDDADALTSLLRAVLADDARLRAVAEAGCETTFLGPDAYSLDPAARAARVPRLPDDFIFRLPGRGRRTLSQIYRRRHGLARPGRVRRQAAWADARIR